MQTQSSVMALLLEALDIQPGMRVLEIGSVGDSTTLLCQLVGDPTLVTTMNDPSLIYRVVSDHVYDRIISTISASPVPPAWLAQLAPGGRLALDFRGQAGGGLMLITKQDDGRSTGRFLAKEPLSLMVVPEQVEGSVDAEFAEMPEWRRTMTVADNVEYDCAWHLWSYEQFHGSALSLWFQCVFPPLSIIWKQQNGETYVVLNDYSIETKVVINRLGRHMDLEMRKSYDPWNIIMQVYKGWLGMGKPGYDAYELLVNGRRQTMRITGQGMTRDVGLVGD